MKKTIINLFLLSFLPLASLAQSARTLCDQGLELKKNGQCREAIEKYKLALAADPGMTEALYERGWCQSELKDFAGAVSTLRKVRDVWNGIAKVHFELGYAFQQLKQKDSALASYDRCLAINPAYSLVFKQRGNMMFADDDFTGALAQFARYIENAKSEITDYIFWYRKGYCENNGKDYVNAKASIARSIQYKNDYATAYLEMGYACLKLKEDDDAIKWYQKAIELEPKSHIGYNGIAEVYRDNKRDMDMAMSWYQKTLSINNTERKANYGMGYCLNSKQRYKEAIPYLKQAIKSEATYSAAYTELGYSYFKTDSDNLALENLNKAIELNPKGANQLYYATLVYIKKKDKPNAEKMISALSNVNQKYAAELQQKLREELP